MGRRFLAFAWFLVFFVACAGGNPPSSDAPAPTTSSEPTLPPAAAPAPAPTRPPNPDDALPPVVASVAPNNATVGSVGPTVIVTGDNFVARTVVQLDGAPLATTFVSTTELRATIPTSALATTGTLRVSAGTSPPGGGASKEVSFDVVNPAPTLTAINPMSVVAGTSSPVTLHVTGSGFVSGAKVVFGSTDLTTTYDGMTSLDATIPAGLLGTSGSAPVKVVNPTPGGGDSTTIAFTVSNPNASIQNVTPSTAFVGAGPLDIVVTGGGFVSASVVQFNAVSLATTYVSGGEVRATIPAAQLVNAGDFPVVVNNPPPGGGPTAPFTFHVVYPAPVATSLSPSSAAAGAAPTAVTVTGSNFFAASQITFDGAPAATTYVDASHVSATLTAAQLATGKTIAVRVVTPSPGGGASGAVSFTVTNPAPSITSLNPSSVTAGSPDSPVVITGSGFLAASVVQSNGVAVAATYNSPTQLTATIPSAQLLYPGSVSITVTNPAPGGGTSAAKTLAIGCDTSGVDVQLAAVGQSTTLATSFAAATKLSVFWHDTNNPWDGSCTTTQLNTAQTQPARYWVVQNTSAAPITLSSWAECYADGKQDDAYLTYYRRPTPPANDTDRLACTGVVSEGLGLGSGWLPPSMSDYGASQYCPGLTKANGGGIPVAVCEKVVVHMQAFSATSTTYTMPPQITIKAE